MLRVSTRGSALALSQTGVVADAIGRASGLPVEIVTVTTQGDTSRESLASLGGTGVFASALRLSLLEGECDLIVHSLKDLPTAPYDGLTIGAFPQRADARDALCARDDLGLAALPEGSKIGTGSPRRVAQLLARRSDVEVVDLRGNVDTRLGRVTDGDLDAVILSAAGLGRLGRSAAITELFSLSEVPTAPGQGALAIEVREGDATGSSPLARALKAIDHVTTRATVTAERAVLAGLEAGCAAPVGVTAMVDDGLFFLTATVYRPDGAARLTSSHAATPERLNAAGLAEAADDVARRVVADLLESGAADLAPMGGAR